VLKHLSLRASSGASLSIELVRLTFRFTKVQKRIYKSEEII